MNQPTFFFYDLETSGLNPREDRIMQFAGQRTDMELNKIGEPVNLLIKMTNDTLPSPQAIMVTKITPQQTQADGLTEAEFCQYSQDEIFTENTCAVGYNSIRFDDEFMRHLFWRNFRDPYEWQWSDGRSRWDLLDVVRLTRALRPEGINWPVVDGKATNRLELLTKENGISHEHAHDALSDVEALISVTKLIKEKQPQLYDWLYKIKGKKAVQQLINLENPAPFVYACGRYPAEYGKTTVAYPLTPGRNGNVLVYDLRYDPDEIDEEKIYPVVKELCYNKCPAVAPLGVLDKADGWQKISLSKEQIEHNLQKLLSHPEFAEKMRTMQEERPEFPEAIDPESALYDSFVPDADKTKIAAVRNANANSLADFHPDFLDERLPELLLHYKAKNYPSALDENEEQQWEKYRIARLNRQAPAFATAMAELGESGADDFILEELNLWYQSLQQ
ncbi:exodeoxyribonuclease I [Candidatus Saccharibacteria bacterium]|nr:exodeoxyribonuclease I [Candidatus Saccharibacteria bacterium]